MPASRLRRPFVLVLAVAVAASIIAVILESPKLDARAVGLDAVKLKRLDDMLQDAVDRKRIAGSVALLARHGKIGYLKASGWRDAEAKKPMTPDTLFRLASMTKPITSVAVLMLVEDGKVRLNDPVSKYLPEFKNLTVCLPGENGQGWKEEAAQREVTIHDLLTHTSGLTYRLWGIQPWAELYRKGGVSDGMVHPEGVSADNVRRLAKQPLMFQPGSAWGYGLSTDVLGVLVEAVSGQDLATFCGQRIFAPLQMRDTYFFVPQAKQERLASVYQMRVRDGLTRIVDEPITLGELVLSTTYPCEKDSRYFSGGAGLVSTALDYLRFLKMLLNGGALDGVRLLQPETAKRMTTNRIGNTPMNLSQYGDGFGYGVGVLTEKGKHGEVASVGTYCWSGTLHTYFWVDPKKELIGILMTQMFVIGDIPLWFDFKKRAYESLVD